MSPPYAPSSESEQQNVGEPPPPTATTCGGSLDNVYRRRLDVEQVCGVLLQWSGLRAVCRVCVCDPHPPSGPQNLDKFDLFLCGWEAHSSSCVPVLREGCRGCPGTRRSRYTSPAEVYLAVVKGLRCMCTPKASQRFVASCRRPRSPPNRSTRNPERGGIQRHITRPNVTSGCGPVAT